MKSLDNAEMTRPARVIMIEGGQGIRSHLNTLGIHIGDWVTVVERAPFRGPILIQVNGARLALGRGIAQRVKVEVEADSTVSTVLSGAGAG